VGLGAILNGDLAVALRNLPGRSYNVTETELVAIAAIVKQVHARVAFEIGTADGRTTVNIGDNMASQHSVFTLNLALEKDPGHSQDLPVGYYFLRHPPAARIVQLWGDSKTFDFSPYWGSCQAIFIDGDHFEPGVSNDSNIALRLVDQRNGVILWHDALRFDVQKVLPKLAKAQKLPIHLISNTNLAALFFLDGQAVDPSVWGRARATPPMDSTDLANLVAH
jgi:hypothetical protein